MNEQEQASQLSALFDAELPATQAELVLRRALKDPGLREAWSRYSLIGAAMRGEPLAVTGVLGEDLASCVSARLANDTGIPLAPAPAAAVAARSNWARGAWGMAIAASVAAVSLLVLRAQAPDAASPAVQVAAAEAPAPAAALVSEPAARTAAAPAAGRTLVAQAEPDSPGYTTPVDNSPPNLANAPLVNYVVAHSDLPASVVRFGPLSSVVSASYDPAEGAVEMSEAEIGAHR
ncbi:MAG: sigma-E factor negative regulatory protein [Steroidobacteraceae bacterium]